LKRLFVLLAALAALSAVIAGSAFAGGGTTTCTGGQITGPINNNLDIPAGARCFVGYPTEVKGNVTVEGSLISFGATFDKNVTVTGGTFKAENGGTTILGNLTITGSAGDPTDPRGDFPGNGLWGVQPPDGPLNAINISGNVTYTGNSAPFYVGNQVFVGGNFTSSLNTSWVDATLLHVGGQKNIS
jgi:hypothetical protein